MFTMTCTVLIYIKVVASRTKGILEPTQVSHQIVQFSRNYQLLWNLILCFIPIYTKALLKLKINWNWKAFRDFTTLSPQVLYLYLHKAQLLPFLSLLHCFSYDLSVFTMHFSLLANVFSPTQIQWSQSCCDCGLNMYEQTHWGREHPRCGCSENPPLCVGLLTNGPLFSGWWIHWCTAPGQPTFFI